MCLAFCTLYVERGATPALHLKGGEMGGGGGTKKQPNNCSGGGQGGGDGGRGGHQKAT